MSKIIYTNSDGNLIVIHPVESDITEVAKKAVPDGIAYETVEDSVIPTDRSFREAWKQNNKTIETDMAKAKEVHKNKIRVARELLLNNLDIEYIKALETGADASAIIAKKKALRDAPADSAIDAATDEAALKAQWNTSILGNSPYSS